jgi:lipoate-protein ligase A
MNSADRRPAVAPLCRELDVYHDQIFRSAALNMAIDEALLEMADRPAIRFYRWDHPALSLGYFGKFAAVKNFAGERDMVRRWTGGGIVFHGEDLTYGLVIPSSAGMEAPSSRFVYTAVHEAIGEALQGGGVVAKLASSDATSDSEACFERPVISDLMVSGRKVAGAAHRRTRRGLLHQGSIQNTGILGTLASSIAGRLAVKVEEQILDKAITSRAAQIAEAKYSAPEWLQRW